MLLVLQSLGHGLLVHLILPHLLQLMQRHVLLLHKLFLLLILLLLVLHFLMRIFNFMSMLLQSLCRLVKDVMLPVHLLSLVV